MRVLPTILGIALALSGTGWVLWRNWRWRELGRIEWETIRDRCRAAEKEADASRAAPSFASVKSASQK